MVDGRHVVDVSWACLSVSSVVDVSWICRGRAVGVSGRVVLVGVSWTCRGRIVDVPWEAAVSRRRRVVRSVAEVSRKCLSEASRRRLKVDHAQAEPPAREARMLGEAGGEAAAQGVRRRQGGRRRHQVHVQPRRRPARSDGRGDACSDGREEGGVGGKGEVDHRRIRPASHRRRRRGAAGGVAVPCCLARDSAHVPHHPAVQNLPRAAARRLATAARRPAERRSHLGPGVAKDGAAQAPRVQGAARAQHIATSRVRGQPQLE